MEHLYERLSGYVEGDIYPYHMPGHKRQKWGELPEAVYRMDITEIEGFDNLHQPEEILLELQKEAARLYGAEESYYLVNGSTCGILSAVSSALPFGGHILMSRNCHKSAYHAAYLRHLKISYLYSDYLERYGICDAVTPGQVRRALKAETDISAVLVVSPTYEGRVADIDGIARIVHEKGIPLIVDEAHGAHLGLAEGFPPNSCQAGADLVIHSVHKTLPALTQTALLHVNGDMIDRDRLRRFLRIYQTSSPSYLLMAGIDNALEYVGRQGKTAFAQFRERYGKMLDALSGCRCLQVLSGDSQVQDVGKLVVSAERSGITGKQLADILLKEYHLQTEMSSRNFVLAMFTLNDGEEAYRRMTEALLEIDGRRFMKDAQGDTFHVGDLPDKEVQIREPSEKESSEKEPSETEPSEKEPSEKEPSEKEPSEKEPSEKEPSEAEPLETEPSEAEPLEAEPLEKELSEKEPLETEPSEKELSGREPSEKEPSEDEEDEERKSIPLWEAWDTEAEEVALKDSIGRCAAEFVNLYPPGVPLLVPGERMTERLYREIIRDLEAGLTVQGIRIKAGNAFSSGGIYIKTVRT